MNGVKILDRSRPSTVSVAHATSWVTDVVAIAAVGLAYYLAARLGLRFALVENNVTPVWPPTGIALVGLLVFGRKVWPAIVLAAFLVNVSIGPAIPAFFIALGNTAAPLVAAMLLKRVGFRRELDRLRDAIALVFLAALIPMAVSATVGTVTLIVSGVPVAFWSTWSVWWTGDAMGVLVFAPFLLAIGYARRHQHAKPARIVEAVILFTLLIVVARVVFLSRLDIEYVIFPIVGWSAWRYQQRGAAPAALIASGIAIWAAVHGTGPFAHASLFKQMVTLQVFNAGVAYTGFVLAALVTERINAREALRVAGDQLEERVHARTTELSEANARLEQESDERQRTSDELRRAGQQLSQAQEIAHIGSWEWDIPNNLVTWSDELYRIYGLAPQEFEATYEGFLDRVHPTDREMVHDSVQAAYGASGAFRFDHRIVRPDGEIRVLSARGEVVADASGKAFRMLGTGQDITEQRDLENSLRRFIANASHELRTPLTVVSGVAALLAERRHRLSQEEFDECLDAIGRQGARTRKLIGDLLDLSRIENGWSHGAPVPVQLAEVARLAIDENPSPARTTVSLQVDENLAVLADPERLGQVFVNLLTNAYKYGGPHVTVAASLREAMVHVVVSDDGPGLSNDLVSHLFEPFARARTGAADGSGLGLTIVRSLVESFDGTVVYEPGTPNGSRFVFTLHPAA